MAIYKPTYCEPFLSTEDFTTITADNPLYLYCKIASSNFNVTGYSIRLLDENNNLLFPAVAPTSLEISAISFIKDLELGPDGDTNSGRNGTFLKIPFYVGGESKAQNTVARNQININDDIELQNGASYKWIITLYQLEPNGASYIIPTNVNYYDIILASGVIAGSTPKRIQTMPSDKILSDYYIQPVQISNLTIPASSGGTVVGPLVSDRARVWQNPSGSITPVGSRGRIYTYDNTLGHLYPQLAAEGAWDNIVNRAAWLLGTDGVANGFQVFKQSGNWDDLQTTQRADTMPYAAIPWTWVNTPANASQSYGLQEYWITKEDYNNSPGTFYPFDTAKNLTLSSSSFNDNTGSGISSNSGDMVVINRNVWYTIQNKKIYYTTNGGSSFSIDEIIVGATPYYVRQIFNSPYEDGGETKNRIYAIVNQQSSFAGDVKITYKNIDASLASWQTPTNLFNAPPEVSGRVYHWITHNSDVALEPFFSYGIRQQQIPSAEGNSAKWRYWFCRMGHYGSGSESPTSGQYVLQIGYVAIGDNSAVYQKTIVADPVYIEPATEGWMSFSGFKIANITNETSAGFGVNVLTTTGEEDISGIKEWVIEESEAIGISLLFSSTQSLLSSWAHTYNYGYGANCLFVYESIVNSIKTIKVVDTSAGATTPYIYTVSNVDNWCFSSNVSVFYTQSGSSIYQIIRGESSRLLVSGTINIPISAPIRCYNDMIAPVCYGVLRGTRNVFYLSIDSGMTWTNMTLVNNASSWGPLSGSYFYSGESVNYLFAGLLNANETQGYVVVSALPIGSPAQKQQTTIPVASNSRIVLNYQPNTTNFDWSNSTTITPSAEDSAFNGIFTPEFSTEFYDETLTTKQSFDEAMYVKVTVYWRRTIDADTWGELLNKIVMINPNDKYSFDVDGGDWSGQNIQINVDSNSTGGILNDPTYGTFKWVAEKPIKLYELDETNNPDINNTALIFYNNPTDNPKEAIPSNTLFLKPLINLENGNIIRFTGTEAWGSLSNIDSYVWSASVLLQGGGTIEYDLDGGINNPDNPTYWYRENAPITLLPPTKQAFVFVGWTWEGQTEPQSTVTLDASNFGNKTFVANWTASQYTITYVLNGGELPSGAPYGYVTTESTSLVAPSRTGYSFIGWTYSGQAEPVLEVTIPIGASGDKEYTANWQANSYTVTFDANGGSISSPSQTVTYDAAYTLLTPTRTGYTFIGWENSDVMVPTTGASWDIPFDLTLVAKWEQNANTTIMVFSTPFGTTPNSQVVAYNAWYTLPTIPDTSSWHLDGWYYKQLFEPQFQVGYPGDTVENTFNQPTKTLYAYWVQIL